jgi:tetratricopeptide (TPR) repeat protein
MKNKLFLAFIALLLSGTSVFAQEQSSVLRAFTESYTHEKSQLYLNGVESLKKVYDETNYEINLRLGWLYYLAAKSNDAVTHYQKAIAAAPGSVEARLGIVFPLSALEKWDDVLAQYKEILKLDPGNGTALYRSALILYNKAKYEEATPILKKYSDLYPFDYDGLSLNGWLSLKKNDKVKALEYFKKAQLNRPGDKVLNDTVKSLMNN